MVSRVTLRYCTWLPHGHRSPSMVMVMREEFRFLEKRIALHWVVFIWRHRSLDPSISASTELCRQRSTSFLEVLNRVVSSASVAKLVCDKRGRSEVNKSRTSRDFPKAFNMEGSTRLVGLDKCYLVLVHAKTPHLK